MLSDAERDILVALQDQIRAQALQLTVPAEGARALTEAQQRLAQHPEEHRRIVGAMRWASPHLTLANIQADQLVSLLHYQPPSPLI